MRNKFRKPKVDLQVTANQLEKEIVELEKKYGLSLSVTLDFPMYKELPEEVRLAIIILNKHGAKFVRAYKEN